MTIDSTRRLQSLYVPVSDGACLAVDVWLPVGRIAGGERVSTAFRATRYHRAEQPPSPEPEADSNHAAGELWTSAGFALVVADARGTGASFGSRTIELGPGEIADYGELIDWVAAQPWSNGRVGVYGTSYEGQAAELLAGLGNPHVVAVAALFSPLDPYRELFYPGGCATSGRFARWMCESQIRDGVAGAVERLSELTGRPAEELSLPPPVKPADGPDGPALLEAAIDDHQRNVDMHTLLDLAAFSDDRLAGLDWEATSPAAARQEIEDTGLPMLIRAGWLDAAFAAGALRRFATFTNHQEVEIGPWGHGGGTFADTLRPDGTLDGNLLSPEGQDRRLVEFFTRYVQRDETPDGEHRLTFGTLGTDQWHSAGSWPPEDAKVQTWYLVSPGRLAPQAGPAIDVRHVTDPAASTGPANRWLAVDLGRGAAYPDRRHADQALLTFTSDPLPAALHVAGFPVVSLRLATSGSDGAIYTYLEDVAPDGEVTYLTEGCLRFVHRATTGPARPSPLGVPRSFARANRLTVTPGQDLDLAVELLPVAALVRAGHKIRVALSGHDAACFNRYGPPDQTFTLHLGEHSTLDLPMLTSGLPGRTVAGGSIVTAMSAALPVPDAPVVSVAGAIARMEAIASALSAADGLACFNRMYLDVTRQVNSQLGQGFFADPAFMTQLDVAFANLYFAAAGTVTTPAAVPPAWRPLAEQRDVAGIEPVQFALAGMNAHINHDLPIAMVSTCTALATAPDAGTHFADYQKVDQLLDAAEQSIRQSFESAAELAVDRHMVAVANLVATWTINGARDMAWNNCLLLWAVRDDPIARGLFLDTLATSTALASTMLLVAV